MSSQVVYYSLAFSGDDSMRIFQLLYSLFSLRRYNRTIPIYLHVSGEIEPLMGHFLAHQLGVTSLRFGSYATMLETARPGAAAALADYPILHKFLSMVALRDSQPDQVLYVDNDTYFFADPAPWMARCAEADIYAREEPFSRASPLGYDPDAIDEDRYLALLGGAPYLPPFNTGVMILNHGIWNRFLDRVPQFMDQVLAFTAAGVGPESPYPGNNLWIRDQLAFWLTLAPLPGFSLARLTPRDVLMGCEELQAWQQLPSPVVSHYFGVNTYRYFERLPEWPYSLDQGP